MLTSKFYTYILTNKTNKVLHTGMSDNICKRVYEHKQKLASDSSNQSNVDKLVYYEAFEDSETASGRELEIKAGTRKEKLKLVENMNPDWHDLYVEVCPVVIEEVIPVVVSDIAESESISAEPENQYVAKPEKFKVL